MDDVTPTVPTNNPEPANPAPQPQPQTIAPATDNQAPITIQPTAAAPTAAPTPATASPEPVTQAPTPGPTPNVVPAPTTAAPTPTPSTSAPGAKKILLVEDDDALASVYVTRLIAEGFDVKRTPNGEDALATALQYKPDLILLDVMMPKVSGFDVLDILRNTPETAAVKVVMLTALSQDSDKERATKLGADDYLVKSQVVIADVVDRIKHHLGM